jgi:hypothetical protein
VSLSAREERLAELDLVSAVISLSSMIVLACWVALASRKVWEAERPEMIWVSSDLTLIDTSLAKNSAVLSVILLSRRKATALIALAASEGILGVRDAVRRTETILERS